MEHLKIHRDNPPVRAVSRCADTVNRGGVVLIPGDTSYLLAVKVGNKGALERLNRIKGRQKRKYYSVVLKGFSDIARYADISDIQYRLMKRVFPGPYTFIVKASREIPKIMLQKRKEIGIRMPDEPFVSLLVDMIDAPLLVSTAVTNSVDVLEDPEQFGDEWNHGVDTLVDAGIIPAQLTSVINITGDEWVVVREGKGDISFL